MGMVKLPLAACILVASGIAGSAVEMTRPFEALEQSRRAMMELDKRQKHEEVERLKRERDNEATRKREEAGQRKRERAEKAEQETQRKHATEKGEQSVVTVPAGRSVDDKRNPRPSPEPPQAARQGAEGQPPVRNAPPAGPQVGTPPPAVKPMTPPAAPSQPNERRAEARAEPGKSPLGETKEKEEPKEGVKSAGQPGDGATIVVSRLKRMNLYNDQGDKLGDVERVLQGSDGAFHIIIGVGFRIRDRDVRIPLRQVTLRKDRLIARGLSDEQVKIMPVFDGKDRTYRDVARNTPVPLVSDASPD